MLIAGVILWVTHSAFVSDHTQGSIWFVILGYLVNCFSIGIVLMMSISQRAVRWLIAFWGERPQPFLQSYGEPSEKSGGKR